MSCYQSLLPFSLNFSISGNTVNAAFPVMSRQATFTYGVNLAILGLQMSSSILVDTSGIIYVALIANQNGALINVDQNTAILASHLSARNTVSGSNFFYPANSDTFFMFPDDAGIAIPTGTPVSLYVSTNNIATSKIAAVATIFTILTK